MNGMKKKNRKMKNTSSVKEKEEISCTVIYLFRMLHTNFRQIYFRNSILRVRSLSINKYISNKIPSRSVNLITMQQTHTKMD